MGKDNVIAFMQPGEFNDQLTAVLRQGAQRVVLQAVEAEFASFLDKHDGERLADGRKRIVRHGHLPERKVVTGIGSVPVQVPRSRDRKGHQDKDVIRFVSQLLPPYVRRSKSVEMAIPYLYLKGISSGDFCEVMPVLLGRDVVGFSADTVLSLASSGSWILRIGRNDGWTARDIFTFGLTGFIYLRAWRKTSNVFW
jgi:hypothetical protein